MTAHVVHATRLPFRRLAELNTAISMGHVSVMSDRAKAAREVANGLPADHPMRTRLLARVKAASIAILDSYGRPRGPDGAA